METKWGAWMVVSVLVGTLMAFGGADPKTGTVTEQILQESEDSVKQIKTVIENARQGNPESQYQLGMMIKDKAYKAGGVARAEAMLEALTWFTRAAEQDNYMAYMALHHLYSAKYPPAYSFMTNYVLSYAWLKIALNKGVSSTTNGQPSDKVLRKKMTAEQVAEAEKLAADLQERISSLESK